MPDPVRAWAAVAPDGTLRPMHTRDAPGDVWDSVVDGLVWDPEMTDEYRAGWRVVPVKIVPMEGGDV